MFGWNLVKKIILFILVLSCIENNVYSAGYWNHFSYMDSLDHRFNSIIVKDRFGVDPTWNNLFEVYKKHKAFFLFGRVKSWEGSPEKDMIERLKYYGIVYVCGLNGEFLKVSM